MKENGFRNQIQRNDKRIAKTRARVEHVFGADGQMGSKLLRTIGQARANFAIVDDGSLLQLEAAGLFPGGWNQNLLTPEMGRIAMDTGDSRQKQGMPPRNAVICQRI